jgi:hypothetical protein
MVRSENPKQSEEEIETSRVKHHRAKETEAQRRSFNQLQCHGKASPRKWVVPRALPETWSPASNQT